MRTLHSRHANSALATWVLSTCFPPSVAQSQQDWQTTSAGLDSSRAEITTRRGSSDSSARTWISWITSCKLETHACSRVNSLEILAVFPSLYTGMSQHCFKNCVRSQQHHKQTSHIISKPRPASRMVSSLKMPYIYFSTG